MWDARYTVLRVNLMRNQIIFKEKMILTCSLDFDPYIKNTKVIIEFQNLRYF